MDKESAKDAIVKTALAMIGTIERGEPFIFEAAEGNFLVFRCDDGSIGVTPADNATGIQN